MAVQYSDYLGSLDPAPPSDLRVRFEGGAAHLTWRDNAPDADGYEVEYTVTGVIMSQGVFIEPEGQGPHRGGSPLESTEPGRRYDFRVRATKGDERSPRSNKVLLVVPGEPIAAPSDVSATFESIQRGPCPLDGQLGQRIVVRRAASPGRRADLPEPGGRGQRVFLLSRLVGECSRRRRVRRTGVCLQPVGLFREQRSGDLSVAAPARAGTGHRRLGAGHRADGGTRRLDGRPGG